MAFRDFSFLSDGSETVRCTMSHSSPMYRKTVLNGTSLDFSHGMPRWAATRSMSSMQYENSASCADLGDWPERSRSGKLMSSSHSMMRPSGRFPAWYHHLPSSVVSDLGV